MHMYSTVTANHFISKLTSTSNLIPCPIAQPVVILTAGQGIASTISAQSHIFVEINHEIISTALLPLIQEELLPVTSESMCTKYWLTG